MIMSTNLPATRALRRLLQWRMVLSLLFCLTLALAPSLAEARAGGSSAGGKSSSSSMGSRGSRTIENNGAAPVTRSMSPATPATSAATGMAGGAAAATGGSFFQRHPFLTGIAGGFLGSMLFSHLGGFGHAMGGILQFLIIGLLIFFAIRLAMRFFGSRSGAPAAPMRTPLPQPVGAAVSPAPRYRGVDTTVNDGDLEAFQGIHAEVQEAWSKADLGRLRQVMTPEMLGYFSEELTKNSSQGVQNVVSNVQLLKGDVSEAWDEGDLQYATACMRWSAIDYVARIGRSPGMPDYVAGGDPNRPIEAEEVWTFVRRRGGNWLLSAIQQV
jgi:predicted lipid-binding transport protein (Tim44 family)